MKKVFCDNCGTEISSNFSNSIFGYDACNSPTCEAELTLRAGKERYAYPTTKNIPTKEHLKKAKENVS